MIFKKNRSDIVKFRFLQSQKNYYKRISNLKDFNDLKNNLNNFKLESNDFEKNKSIKKRNNALLNSYKEKASLPFIYNSIQNSHYKNNNKKNKIIYINFKNKDRKEDIIQKQKLFRHIEQNFSSNRIKINKLKKEEEKNINKINNNNKSNNNRYINNISSESNKSKENKKLNTINKKFVNKILSKNLNHKIIHIKKGIFDLNKNILNISSGDKEEQENKDTKKIKNKNKKNFFKENNIKSIFRIKRVTIDNSSLPEINENLIFNPLLREKLFH